MQRYFVKLDSDAKQVVIDGDDFHHIVRVMRMKLGDQLIIVNQEEKRALCQIAEITDEKVLADVVKWEDGTNELPVRVTIASGLPKGDKLEWIIQKGTEMGAYEFVPFIAARSIVKWDEKKAGKKLERWQKIAKEAAEQSNRDCIPVVSAPVNIKSLMQKAKDYDVLLVAFEEEAKQGETAVLAKTLSELHDGQSVLVVFGPEGGISLEEIDLFKDNGFAVCGLGPRILRTETAPLYLLAAISYHIELLR